MTEVTWDPSVDVFGTCDRAGCNEVCPWDMAAVMLGEETVCCSPACAEVVLEAMGTVPDAVALHDPQHSADRERLADVPEESIDIICEVEGRDGAETAIQKMGDLHISRFRAGSV